ncbi:MAG: D-alanyl-D-alanine dipeptidase [Crocinitomicaceae bacterium]|jgi:D-alanyl-D-alanine dipeptidase
MKFLTATAILSIFLLSCGEKKKVEPKQEIVVVEEPIVIEIDPMTDSVLARYDSFGLIELKDKRILIDLRYSTDNNFMKTVLYDTLNKLFVQKEVGIRLVHCQDYLDSLYPGLRLKIFDGVRPLQVQREMWDAMDTVPAGLRGKFVSNPIYGSGHNYGTSVDLTICDSLGQELDMGAGYDDFRTIAFPSKEAHFLKTGELSKEQYENRKLLRKVMRFQRFYGIPSEWWHFNAYSRMAAEARFDLLLDESGNHTRWVSPKIKKDTIVDSIHTIVPLTI